MSTRWQSRWTAEEHRLLRELFPLKPTRELPLFFHGRSRKAIASRAKILGLRKKFGACKGARGPRWTSDRVRELKKSYADTPTPELARRWGYSVAAVYRKARLLGLRKCEAFLQSDFARGLRADNSCGIPFRFQKGHVPANKGLRRPGYSLLHGRMSQTTFKKGQRSPNYLPVGTVKFNGDGYLVRKIDDKPNNGHGALNKNWEFVHRRVWESAHGPIPKGHRIWWKDGNHANCALENLEPVGGKEHMARTTIHTLPQELKSTILWAGALKRRIGRLEREKQAERSPQPFVRNHRSAER